MGLYALAALLVLMSGDLIGLVTSLIMVGVIYFAAYAPLTKGQNATAANGAAIAGGIALVFGFINIMLGQTFAAIYNFVTAAILGFAWNQAKG
ncbi:MAG: hypothetical protein H5T64_12250 [Chloroflexi bacterium]|nr:hypothetical protein [Chloroflexota bacterium]